MASQTGAFTTSARAAKAPGLRNRIIKTVLSTQSSKDGREDDAVTHLQVIHDDGAEHIIERSDGADDDDALFHSYTSISSSASGDARDILDDPAEEIDNNGEQFRPSPIKTQLPPQRRDTGDSFASLKGRRAASRRRSVPVAQSTPSSSSWFGLDLSLIVALASPVGTLLTGSDYFKNVILLLLLVYYLHQLVEGSLLLELSAFLPSEANFRRPQFLGRFTGCLFRAIMHLEIPKPLRNYTLWKCCT